MLIIFEVTLCQACVFNVLGFFQESLHILWISRNKVFFLDLSVPLSFYACNISFLYPTFFSDSFFLFSPTDSDLKLNEDRLFYVYGKSPRSNNSSSAEEGNTGCDM